MKHLCRNPGGIRFGSSEIYNVLEAAFSPSSAHHIVDSLVVGQAIQGGVDERVVLFVKLADGRVLDDALRKAVKTEVRARRTARHVPEKVHETFMRARLLSDPSSSSTLSHLSRSCKYLIFRTH